MISTYHDGERAVQQRAGVEAAAARLGKGIQSLISPVVQGFLAAQRMAVAGSVDADGRVWASLLTGAPGFLRALDAQTVAIAAAPVPGDPLAANLHEGAPIGLVVIDLATRRRVRVNGRAEPAQDGRWLLRTSEVFSNCQQYIQSRDLLRTEVSPAQGHVSRSHALTGAQRDRITRADTFFIASVHPEAGADASHRGGNPGFVRVLDERTIAFPDYAGNNIRTYAVAAGVEARV
jgi:predicted pyridoxine 5'-phosphate oxidase superfamily flavin-nucleotide-binding protein